MVTVSGVTVISHADKDALAQGAANHIASFLAGSPGDTATLGLAGGSTPAATYVRLREADVAWERVDAWLSDERWVPHDHPDSNGRMAAENLMDHVDARFARPRWSPNLTASDSAGYYEATLRSIHADRQPDLILLGMGADGHTASLFPGTAALQAPAQRWFVANHVPKLETDRLTATYAMLQSARQVMFLVAGADKAAALRQVLEPGPDEERLPATGVMGGEAEVVWMVDEAAASELANTEIRRA